MSISSSFIKFYSEERVTSTVLMSSDDSLFDGLEFWYGHPIISGKVDFSFASQLSLKTESEINSF